VKIRFKYSSILRNGRARAADLIFGLRRELPRFTADRRGNVAMIFALCSIPILFAVGAAIDYTSATRRKAKLDAIADAVALSTVTQSGNPPAFSPIPNDGLTASLAKARAQSMFTALAGTVSGVSNFNGTVTVVDSTTSQTSPRQTTVSYTAQSNNAFGQIIGMNSIGIGNTSSPVVAQVAIAPNINFYILADSSPSMAIPATTTGIDQMYTATSTSTGGGGDNESGCSFACHESDYTKWVLPGSSSCIGVITKTGTYTTGSGKSKQTQSFTYYAPGTSSNPGYVDDYTYAECVESLTLRIDNLRSAIQQLGPYALSVASVNGATYNMAVATFDTNWTASPCTNANSPLHFISGGSTMTPQNMSTASSAAANIQMAQTFNNSYLGGTNQTSSTTPNQYQESCSWNDGGTALDAAMKDINSLMPTPGNGTNASNDSPQEVLMLITDGVNDTYVSSSSAMSSSSNSTGSGIPGFGTTAGRNISVIDTTQCAAIQQKISASGLPIRIAVLYLDYSDLDTTLPDGQSFSNSFFNSYVSPIDENTSPTANPNIESALESCASSPQLFGKVTTGQDIAAALQQLFLAATATVHLAQ
jgi:Flp pilus assembly protein TadG